MIRVIARMGLAGRCAERRSSSARGAADADRAHRGVSTLNTIIGTVIISGALGGAAVVFSPHFVRAGALPSDVPGSGSELADSLKELIESSVEVLAVHPRGATPYAEIVLWVSDAHNPGVIDTNEIGVLSHSKVLRTVTFYKLADGLDDAAPTPLGDSQEAALVPPPPSARSGVGRSKHAPLAAWFAREACTAAAFCDRWRSRPEVAPMVLAGGISDMSVRWHGSPSPDVLDDPEGPRSQLELSLIWPMKNADGVREATVIVEPGAHAAREGSFAPGESS